MRGPRVQTAKIAFVTPLTLTLLPHPSQTPTACAPTVVVRPTAEGLDLHFAIAQPHDLRLPESGLQGAADGLWQHTCFECFVGLTGHSAYTEFNFSPSLPIGQWACYPFSRERERQDTGAPLSLNPTTEIDDSGLHLRVQLPWSILPAPDQAWDLGLSTVTESSAGRITHWAVRHDRAQADFHHRASWLRIAPPWPSPTGQP